MSEDWSRLEVESTVASYFAMLEKELRNEPFVKAEYYRALIPLLKNRTRPAVEKKYGNISAALIELHAPYIAGYKPYRNYQHLLFEVVAKQLEARPELRQLMLASADRRPIVPRIDDILHALVDPPKPTGATDLYRVKDTFIKTVRRVDYLAREAKNRATGDAGEEFIRRFETARLLAARKNSLAAKVERVSVTRGDGDGYDILSFEETGRERLIEVKTTIYGGETPFFVTTNESEISDLYPDQYCVYRVFELERKPRFFWLRGPIGQSFDLSPSEFVARIR